jgi:hypothetical protein
MMVFIVPWWFGEAQAHTSGVAKLSFSSNEFPPDQFNSFRVVITTLVSGIWL